MISNNLNELRALDAKQTIAEQLEAEKLRLQNRMATRQSEAIRKQNYFKPISISPFPNADQSQIDTFWGNATRLGQIQARGQAGTGTMGGAQIMGHVGPSMEGIGGAERAQSVQQPGMATWQADEIRKKALAGLRGARG